jgi:hypothetical protein
MAAKADARDIDLSWICLAASVGARVNGPFAGTLVRIYRVRSHENFTCPRRAG